MTKTSCSVTILEFTNFKSFLPCIIERAKKVCKATLMVQGNSGKMIMIHNMFLIIFIILTVSSTSALSGQWLSISLFQPSFRKTTLSRRGSTSFKMATSSPDKVTVQSTSQINQALLEQKLLKNLKTVPVKEDGALLARWNELKGLSEKELIISSSANIMTSERNEIALSLAYRRCEYVTQLFSKTFYMGTSLMRPDARAHVWAIYAWCRRTDDIVDSPRALLNREVLNQDLEDWSVRLDRIWSGRPADLFDLAMVDTLRAYPRLSIQPFRDMIAGMVMDVPGLGQERYQNFDELYTYCYRVAGTVGLMTLPILGAAEGYTEEQASEPAIALGIGLQLTNILRDVGEDLERGRIYLPLDEIHAFGLTEDDIFSCQVTPKYKEFMKFQIQRARDYYTKAKEGIPMLAPDARFAVQASLDLYSRILTVIERNDYDNFRKRAFTTKFEKISILPSSWLTVNQVK